MQPEEKTKLTEALLKARDAYALASIEYPKMVVCGKITTKECLNNIAKALNPIKDLHRKLKLPKPTGKMFDDWMRDYCKRRDALDTNEHLENQYNLTTKD